MFVQAFDAQNIHDIFSVILWIWDTQSGFIIHEC